MEEYTRANIKDNNQTCIDYLTLEKYNTSYIQEGDLLICTGDLRKKGYSMEDDTHSDTGYNFPFAVKAYIEDDTKVIGDLKKGKRVKVTYKDENVDFDNMKLQSIEVVEN